MFNEYLWLKSSDFHKKQDILYISSDPKWE